MADRGGRDQLRLMTMASRLYHEHGIRQRDIATRLGISQPRVSRLLAQAEEQGIVRTGAGVGRWRVPDDIERSWTADRVFEPEMDETMRTALYGGWCDAVRHVPRRGGRAPGGAVIRAAHRSTAAA
jgi:DNA-binding Lrp family transcriptional regulator